MPIRPDAIKPLLLLTCAFACTGAFPSNGLVYSSNIHAIARVETQTTNVIVAVPWRFYTPQIEDGTPIPIHKLVKPFNLTEGDMLLFVNERNEYETWMLVNVSGTKFWQPSITVFTRDGRANETKVQDYSEFVERGLGLWVIRQHPMDASNHYKPIYLYGQWCDETVQLTINGGSSGTNAVMVANPSCESITHINGDIAFENVSPNDTLSVPNGSDAWNLCLWDATLNKWYWSSSQRVGRTVRTIKNYELTIGPGQGFWYIRRANGNGVKITFSRN